MRIASRRRSRLALRSVIAAAMLLVTSTAAAAAQTFTVGYAPGAGPGTGFGLLRFGVTAGSNGLLLQSLTIGSPANYTFVSLGGGVGVFSVSDDLGEYSDLSTVGAMGESVFIDFTGGSAFPPFTLGANSSGWIDVQVAESEAPAPFVFTYTGTLVGGEEITGTITGNVSTVPEPGTVGLLATGLIGLGLVARRKVRG
jgi:hypothetical protein